MRVFRAGAIKVPTGLDPAVRKVFELMIEERLGPTDVAERAGIAITTISRWRTRHPPTLPTLQAALGVFGYELVVRKTKAREEEDRLYARAGFVSEARMDALLEEAAISTRLAAQTALSGPENGSEGHVGGGAR